MNNNNTELNKEQQPKQQNKKIIYIILGITICIIFLLGVELPSVIDIIKPKDNETVENNNSKKDEDTTKDDEAKRKYFKFVAELSYKIDSILVGAIYEEGKLTGKDLYSSDFSLYLFRTGVLKNPLTAEQKQFIVLDSLDWGKVAGDDWKKNSILQKEYGEFEQYYIRQISEDTVNTRSLRLFGHKVENPIEQISAWCRRYIYDANQRLYFLPDPACGGTGVGNIHTYKSKFIKDEEKKEAYVYMSFAYVLPDPNNDYTSNDSEYLSIVYKDFDHGDDYNKKEISMRDYNIKFKNEYKLTEYEQKMLNDYEKNYIVVNESNYQEFSEYKFTFKQDESGNYYFVKVEQTK